MLDGITVERVEGCRQLLREFDGQRHELERTLVPEQYQRAFGVELKESAANIVLSA